jgi:hypothetical protein
VRRPIVPARTRNAIASTRPAAPRNKDFFVQFALPGVIDIDGDTATASCVCYEAARGGTTVFYRTHCLVTDRLQRAGDGWVFTSRTFQYVWLDTSPFTGDGFDLPPAPGV